MVSVHPISNNLGSPTPSSPRKKFTDMYVSLDYNHRLSYSYLIKPFLEFIKKADRSKLQGKTLAIEFSPFKVTDEYMYPDLIGVRYRAEYIMGEGEEYPIGISLEWTTPDGTPHRQIISLTYERSNLGSGYVGYFLCPQTGRKCRKLYTDGRIFCSRHYLGNRYSYQNESRTSRACSKMHRNSGEHRDKIAAHRQTYKGKPTKWAVRLNKMYAKEWEAWGYVEEHLVNRLGRLALK